MTQPLRLASMMLLSLLLLAPGVGLATPQDAPVQPSQNEPQLQPQPESKPETFTRAPLALRLLSETAFGGLGAVGGWFAGNLIGSALCTAPANSGAGACISEFVYGGIAGAALVLPLGVWLGGNIAHGTGSLVSTYLGGLVGAAAGGLLVAVSGSIGVLLTLGVALPLIGSIIGYETSMSGMTYSMKGEGTRLQPLLSVSPHGGFVGLGGHF
jgi:hypothetical protein